LRSLFYVDELAEVGGTVVVDGDEGHHAATVCRTRVGEELDLADGAGTVAHVVVTAVAKGRLDGRGAGVATAPARHPAGHRGAGAAEIRTLGAGRRTGHRGRRRRLPGWQAGRCVARWESAAKIDKGLKRWSAVARSAARQSRRPVVPTVDGLVNTRALIARAARRPHPGAARVGDHTDRDGGGRRRGRRGNCCW
jgi:16S rRNA (uracil1498-N3)-methyltransferase